MLQKEMPKPKENVCFGRHIIAEVYCGNKEVLNDERRLLDAIGTAARRAGMTVISGSSHKFCPQGATAMVLLAESHVSIHTWPEHNYAALDVYTCGGKPEMVFEELKKLLPIREIRVMDIDRGPE